MPPHAGPARLYLAPLQGLRFFAALHIVILHTLRAGWLPTEVERLASWGGSTVTLFFLLSGFILTYAYASPGGMRVPPRVMWRRRFSRLYPLALLSHLATVPLVWETYGPAERWVRAGLTAAGLQAWWPPYAASFNSPGWSLSYLALAFLLLPFVLRWTAAWDARRLWAGLAALWLAMLAPAALYTAVQPAGDTWRAALFTFPLARLPEFLFGVVLARLFTSRAWPAPPGWLVPAVLAALAASLMFTPAGLFELNHNGLFVPLHALLVWGLAASAGRVQALLSARWAMALGDSSFALYLLHVPVYAWVYRAAGTDVGAWGTGASAALYATYLLLTIGLAWLAERYVVAPIAGRLGGEARPAATGPAGVPAEHQPPPPSSRTRPPHPGRGPSRR